MDEKTKIQIRKNNMKIFPICRTLGWDFIFFYTINFLFLTQIKNISPADIVLTDAFFYSIFGVITQIPATFLIELLGRKNSAVLGNILNCIYITIILLCNSVYDLILAEFICSIAFAIKESAEPAILNSSIPPSKNKGKIFAKISQKGVSGYYILNSISTILAGFFYDINPYIPMILALTIQVTATIVSLLYKEPVERKKKNKIKPEMNIKNIKQSLIFITKSERIKALILCVAVISGVFTILTTYEVSLLEELQIPAKYIGITFAILGIISAKGTNLQHKFHEKYTNHTLKILGLSLTISCLIAGIAGAFAYKNLFIALTIILTAYAIKYIVAGIYYSLIEKYLSNFTNKDIDTKIFTARNISRSISGAITGIMASFLLDRMDTAYCMIIIGIVFTIFMILTSKYMKTRVGLKPEEYPEKEIMYDEVKL